MLSRANPTRSEVVDFSDIARPVSRAGASRPVRQFVRQSFLDSCGLLHPSCGTSETPHRPSADGKFAANSRIWLYKAEGEGFEPSMDVSAHNGFQDRRIQPLCHPSGA